MQFNGLNVFSAGTAASIGVSITTADLTMAANASTTPSQASQISQLQNTTIAGLGGGTFAEYLSRLQNDLGSVAQAAGDRASFYHSLRSTMQEKQQGISGVSIDEELVELIKFQRIFQAASKVIQTSSQLLDTVVNMV